MAKPTSPAPAGALALYEKLVATIPRVERKGATMPYTSVNGNMFSFLASDGTMGLRLPETDRAAFMEKYKTGLSEQYGSVMKEYVDVPAALLAKTAEMKAYFEISFAYAAALKAKPTTRAGKSKAERSGRR
jgi:hypothetical protein